MDSVQMSLSQQVDKHRIESAVLDLSFDNSMLADEFQQQAHSYVLYTLLPAIDRVFEQHQQPGWQFSIDKLEIDLGEIDDRDYLSQLEAKLVTALSEKMLDFNINSGVNGESSNEATESNVQEFGFRKLTSKQSDWEQLSYFLSRGQLPWNSSFSTGDDSAEQWRDWLATTLIANFESLSSLLHRSPHRDSILSRLVLLLPLEASIELLIKLTKPSRNSQVRFLLKLMLNYGHDGANSALEKRFYAKGALLRTATHNEKRFFIRALLNALLSGDTRQSAQAADPIHEWFPAFIDIGQRYIPDELKPEFSAHFNHALHQKERAHSDRTLLVSALFIRAIVTGDSTQLQSVWHLAMGEYSAEFLSLLNHLGQRSEVRYRLSTALNESMWQQLLALMEPTESDFISRVYSVFMPAKLHGIALSSPSVHPLSDSPLNDNQSKQQLWLFTLTYLLVERGGQFNRKSYLQSMLRQSAAHHNISQSKLQQLLLTALESLQIESALKRNMQQLLSEFQIESTELIVEPRVVEVNNRRGLTTEQVALEDIATALSLRDFDRLKLNWSRYVSTYPDTLITSLYLYGHQSSCVKAIVTHFSLEMLRDTLGLLAPKEQKFIQPLIEQTPRQLQKVQMEKPIVHRELSKQLWEFTLSYLLVERGSNFNNLSYLGYVTHKIAAHNNLDHQRFIHHLTQAFYSSKAPSEMQKQLLSILAALLLAPIERPRNRGGVLSSIDKAAAQEQTSEDKQSRYRQFILALVAGDATQLDKLIRALGDGDRAFVLRVLHHFLKPSSSSQGLTNAEAVERYLLTLPESTQAAIIHLLYPTSQQWLELLIGPDSILCVDLPSFNAFRPDDGAEYKRFERVVNSLSLRKGMVLSKAWRGYVWQQIWQSIGDAVTESGAVAVDITELTERLMMTLFSRIAQFRHCSLSALLQAIEQELKVNRVNGYLALLVTRQLNLSIESKGILGGLELRFNSVTADSHTHDDEQDHDLQLLHLEHTDRIAAGLALVGQHLFNAVNQARPVTEAQLQASFQLLIHWVAESVFVFKRAPVQAMSLLKRTMFGSYIWQHIWRNLADIHLSQLLGRLISFMPVIGVKLYITELHQLRGSFTVLSQVQRFSYTFAPHIEPLYEQPVMLTGELCRLSDLSLPAQSTALVVNKVKADQAEGAAAACNLPRAALAGSAQGEALHSGTSEPGVEQVRRGSNHSASRLANSEGEKPAAVESAVAALSAELTSLLVQISQGRSHQGDSSLFARFNICFKALLSADTARLKILLLNHLSSPEVVKTLFMHRTANESHELLLLLFSTQYLSLLTITDLLSLTCDSVKALPIRPLAFYQFVVCSLLGHQTVYISAVLEHYLAMLDDIASKTDNSRGAHARELFLAQLIKELNTVSQSNFASSLVAQCIKAVESLKGSEPAVSEQSQPNPLVDNRQKELSLVELEKLVYGLSESDVAEGLEEEGDKIHIDNAGAVLASPYIPRLFSMLGYTDRGVFIDKQAQERAAHLLQYMVFGSTEAGEFQLTLNKLLCGIKTARPLNYCIALSDKERETADGLLAGIIDNWKTIGQTTPQGLRESFLQREGVLYREKEVWKLQIQGKAFDMLLDSLPWSFSTIKFPWMERVLHVEWR